MKYLSKAADPRDDVGSGGTAYTIDLHGCWGKVNRAKIHIDALRHQIEQQGYPEVDLSSPERIRNIPLRRKFEPEKGAVVWRIDRLLKVSDDWGLIAGDAFHNLRCALDHLAWQLAIRKYNGAAPAERRIIKEIQFPIVLDRDKWSAHRNRIHMLAEDAAKIEKFQPFEMPADDEEQVLAHPLSGLAGFNGFDNIDKHRTLHLTYIVLKDFRAGMSPNAKYTDCVPILESDFPVVFDSITSERPKVGDEVMRAMVRPTGPNPDVDFEPRLTGFVAIGESCDILYALQAMHDAVSSVIEEFEPPLGTVVA